MTASRRPARPADDVWASRRRHPTARPVAARRRSKTYVGLLAIITTLNLLGLVMVLSASSVVALDDYGSSWYVVARHAMWLALGTMACVIVLKVDYHRWRRLGVPALGVTAVLLALVLVPGVGVSANGASRWLGYGPFSLQPSELAKLTMLLFAADLLARRAAWMDDVRLTLVPVVSVFGALAVLLMLQPNLGTTLVLGALVLSLLYVAGTPFVPLTGLAAAGGVVAAGLALWAPYRRARVLAFLDPWADYQNTGYQNIQSLVGVASGGITGAGLGESRAKWGFLPYAHTDFIFAIIGEELGLIGALLVVGLFVGLCTLGARAALLAPDRFGLLLAAGVTVWFGVQAFVNIGAVIGILPITGVPLPFVSYGGSSLLFSMIGAGLLLNVARQARLPEVRRPRATPAPARRAAHAYAVTPPTTPTFAIVTGGGTAGHVLPALAIADALVAAGHPREEIHYVGSERGIEARLVPPTGYPMTLLPGRGIQRRMTVQNLRAIGGLIVAGLRAVALVGRLRPSVVVAVGGYASVAVGLAAVLHRVPIVVAEQNQAPGLANRLLARFAKAAAVSFPGTALPRAVVTGNPIRAEISALDPRRDRAAAKRAVGVEAHRRLLLVVGGSLGALRVNRAVLDALPAWRNRADLAVHHVVGRRDWEVIAAAPGVDGPLQHRMVPYEDDMPGVLAAADLAVCRAGSSTCFELAAAGLPAILVPSPSVTADQQTGNARHLVDAGAAVLVRDDELEGARLAAEVDALLADDARLAAMAAAARTWARPDAAEAIATLAEAKRVADPVLDLRGRRRIHVTNVGGAGMSAVATLLAEMGHSVSGHDPSGATPFLPPLDAVGVAVEVGVPGPLPPVDAVVVSTATPDDHPQVVTARAVGTPVLHRAVALAAICATRRTVAVAGTHGKTTTSALLATLLVEAGQDPGWVVGAAVAGLGRSAAWGGDGPLVVEADESDGTFLSLGAWGAIVTNVEADHLEHWGGEAQLRAAFERFVAALPGPAVLCADDPGAAALAEHAAHPVTYGTSPGSDYRIDAIITERTGVRFTVHHDGHAVEVSVPAAPGPHNARNAAAALVLAHQLDVDLAAAATALAEFRGVARRFEVRGEEAGVVLVDSYDHLPTEVAAALAAARAGDWGRVVCCFQPHRYSRTASLGRTFADCFTDADLLLVTDVYPAGEPPRPGVSGKVVVDAVLDAHPWSPVAWLPTLDDVVAYLGTTLRAGDLCLTLGAGDLTTVPDRLLPTLRARRR